MTKLEQIKILVETKPKNYAKMISNNADLYSEVVQHQGETIPEKVYNMLHPGTELVCSRGNTKKFKSVVDGYTLCGKASTCACAKEVIREASIKSKASMSAEEKVAANERRAKTNLEKYGVENIGQTEKAKAAHAEFYSNPEAVAGAIAKKLETIKNKNS